MKFFSIDLHISVIGDLKKIFMELGHTVDDKCLSGHADIMGRKKDYYKELSGDKWTWYVYNWEFDSFYKNHKDELDKYDGFIVTYPPVFSMLYRETGKPIIVQIPIRYDYGIHGRADLQQKYFDAMRPGIKKGSIKFSANSKYDRDYFKGFSGFDCRHIPSLCEYTGIKYRNGMGPALVYSQREENAKAVGGVWRMNLKRGYPWKQLEKYRAVVHFPYEISTMSIFEHYTANIPMLFPTKKFLKSMYFGGWHGILKQVSTLNLHGKPPKSVMDFRGPVDPNNYKSLDTVRYWMDRADYYDNEHMPHILYFDTIQEAKKILADANLLKRTSEKMRASNQSRKRLVYDKWKEVLSEIRG